MFNISLNHTHYVITREKGYVCYSVKIFVTSWDTVIICRFYRSKTQVFTEVTNSIYFYEVSLPYECVCVRACVRDC